MGAVAQIKYVDVAVNDETAEALANIMEREGVTLPEAFRRLVGYGECLYEEVRTPGTEVLVHRPGRIWRRARTWQVFL